MNRETVLILTVFSTLFCSTVSFAHKINLFVWAENGIITVESSLTGGRTLVHGTVTVVNSQTEETIITGNNDENGTFSFTVPEEILKQSPPLDVIVSGGDGHQAHWLIKADEYGGSAKPASLLPEPDKQPSGRQVADNMQYCLSKAEFEQLLDEHLEQKLAPIRKNIGSLVNHSPSIKDIGAGIGYLIGFAGVIAWFQSRKEKKL